MVMSEAAAGQVAVEPRAEGPTAVGYKGVDVPLDPATEAPSPFSSADLAADLRLVVGRLARSLRQADDGGLTPSQLSALSSIDRLGSVRLGDLAAAERVTSPTLTKIVANLEAAGLVDRSADPDDRRAARVSLSPSGRSRLKRLRTERNAYLQQRLTALAPEDREKLAAALAVLSTLAETGAA